MKKIFISLFGAFLAFGAIAQPTFVSTAPANKNVVLEEYTGKSCGYCPDGHRLANIFANANTGRVVLINIHQGGFANGTPNYKTVWGDALANQTGLTGYPSGTVNRRVFSGANSALDRGQWATKGAIVLNEPSFVNVASKAYIDTITRIITVDVEVYYTGNANSKVNLLNVALLQDSVLGPQTGMTSNPAQVMNGQYVHMHMLRHLFSNQFGDALIGEGNVIASGTFFTKRYVYALPENINAIPLVLKDLNVVAFVSKDNQEIYTGSVGETVLGEYSNAVVSDYVQALSLTGSAAPNCSNTTMLTNLTFKVKNISGSTINSIIVKGIKNNSASTYTYSNPINAGATATIVLPQEEVNNDGLKTTFMAYVSEVDGVNIENTSGIIYPFTLNNPPVSKDANLKVTLYLKTDYFGDETKWNVKDINGSLIKKGGPYANGTNVYDTVDLSLPSIGCYVFEITDAYGDGIGTSYTDNVVGNYKLVDGNGIVIKNSNGLFGMGEKIAINLLSILGLNDIENNISSVNVYPNPVKDIANLEINLNSSSDATIQVLDMLGRNVIDLGRKSMKAGQNTIELNTSNLNNGMYFVKVITNDGIVSTKITISK
ncbi:MAG: Omp28-related outer membrane protein [Bacteroidales bacterium]|nr:Omp28-related outer membrane protein [Bacteroidales bacterium]MDD4683632.1 Omp28-related outer membrane protein [Bacteroidales bacterium]